MLIFFLFNYKILYYRCLKTAKLERDNNIVLLMVI